MLYCKVTWQRTGHMLRILSTLALKVTLTYSSCSSDVTATVKKLQSEALWYCCFKMGR